MHRISCAQNVPKLHISKIPNNVLHDLSTWNPAYTVRTAKKLAEQGVAEKEIVEALQKYAPDIQNLPSAALRQNAAARIAKSAAGSVRAGQKEQDKAAAR